MFPAVSSRRRRPLPPAFILALSMGAAIGAGAILLRLPVANQGLAIGWLDALFTAASAICVTGLVVVDTGSQFTFFGQLTILVLIQIGGLGVMTLGTTILLALGGQPRTSLVRHWLGGLAGKQTISPRDILWTVLATTMIAEAIGAVLLFLSFSPVYPTDQALWLAIFHSISAFCNAGFSLWPDSLSQFAAHPTVNITIMALIVLGGLGFIVLVESTHWIGSRLKRTTRARLSLHSKIILSGSVVAILGGAVFILVLESANVLAHRPWGESLLVAFFQSITARTAGFNTVDIAALSNPTILMLMGLMMIGGGSGSMAGGIKLTTAVTVAAVVAQRLRGNHQVYLFGRSLGQATIQRAFVLSVLATAMVVSVTWLIEFVQGGGTPTLAGRGEFMAVMFEVVSGFGTVGLSMGVTSQLEPLAKGAMIPLMFLGRLGPLILMDFFARLPPPPPLRHVSEDVMIG
jgi:trk system potassium uptake protein